MGRKDIEIIVYSRPDKPELGFGDAVSVTVGDVAVYGGHCSSCPNPFRPSDMLPWEAAYGWIAPGRYQYRYHTSPKWGPCLMLEEGGPVDARLPNANHDGARYLTEVLIHAGGTGKNAHWRGSAGCITIPPGDWADFLSHFEPGDRGTVWVHDFIDGERGVPRDGKDCKGSQGNDPRKGRDLPLVAAKGAGRDAPNPRRRPAPQLYKRGKLARVLGAISKLLSTLRYGRKR